MNLMNRSLTPNQYIIKNGKLEIKNKNLQDSNNNNSNKIRFLTPIKKQINNVHQTHQILQQDHNYNNINNNPQNSDQIQKSNYRYIPYQHTVRKIAMKDYYHTTIAKQKKQIQNLKENYKQLLTSYHNSNLSNFQRENLEKIEQALLLNQPSRVRKIYGLSKSQIMIQPFSSTSINHSNKLNTVKNNIENKCNWDQTPMRSFIKQSAIVESQIVCGRQVIHEKQHLTPKLIAKSIIFRGLEDEEDNRIYQNTQKLLQNKIKLRQLSSLSSNNIQINNIDINSQRKFSKNIQTHKTRGTDQSFISIKSNRDNSKQKQTIQVHKKDFIDVGSHKSLKMQHFRISSMTINNKNQQVQKKQQQYDEQNDDQSINQPVTHRIQNIQIENNQIFDFSQITKTKDGFQLLLNKTIQEHQQLKQLFELYKISSEDRIKQLQQNFQEQLNQVQLNYKKEKENCEKYCKKAKKYKKQVQQKQQIILDLIKKLKFYMKQNQKIKEQERKKAIIQILNIMKQKQLKKMIKSNKLTNNIQQGRNIILGAIKILIQCKIQKSIQSEKSLKDIQILRIHRAVNQ